MILQLMHNVFLSCNWMNVGCNTICQTENRNNSVPKNYYLHQYRFMLPSFEHFRSTTLLSSHSPFIFLTLYCAKQIFIYHLNEMLHLQSRNWSCVSLWLDDPAIFGFTIRFEGDSIQATSITILWRCFGNYALKSSRCH